ncbi:hypothetical protein C1637_01935 [Chryseobacterium lactis]|uniref:Uncharacterized protein n=1 Tax=Chryseobacterium lactis TaxID=1241981 RepID=A0A3G6RX12_CHRLC|nr:hypothetical protein [Chryseobacterium lactis]AZA81357.1 hypothetical protein EG342_05320 [Chryseobacterium lactis]AZB06356.1 hypothetical protein EG341_21445 [Chryseobacterium lactis]PNW15209.1 hypothetical protein C1637_01935 [Chryseobacterium lactis]
MKKLLQIVCTCIAIISFSQAKEVIKLKGNIVNYTEYAYKSIKVIDQREDKQIGEIPFGDNKEMREVVFPSTPAIDFNGWFAKGNDLDKGKVEFVLVLKKLKLSVGESDGKTTTGTMDFSAQTFAKAGDKYQFIYKKDTVFTFNHKEVSEQMVKNIPVIYSAFIKKSYTLDPSDKKITDNDIKDYESYVKANAAALKEEQLKDGIYLSYTSFFDQLPEPGKYNLETNSKGEITKAVKEEDGKKSKISSYKMFAYVEKGKAYKQTFSGFLELNRDEKGFYVTTNRGHLFPVQSNSTYGMFGLIGGIAGAIEQGERQKKMKKQEAEKIYIDPLTGEYDFSGES